jgi:hypothetical protein
MGSSLAWWLSSACCALALARLVRERLYSAHWLCFGAMLAIGIGRDVALRLSGPPATSATYLRVFVLTLPLYLAAECGAAIALSRAIAKQYPRIGTFAVWLFGGSLTVAGLASLVTVQAGWYGALQTEVLAYRLVSFTLAGGLLIAAGVLSLFPAPALRLAANLRLHTRLFAAYLGVYVVGYWMLDRAPQSLANAVTVGGSALLYATWALRLSAAGERVTPWPRMSEELASAVRQRSRAAVQALQKAAGGSIT